MRSAIVTLAVLLLGGADAFTTPTAIRPNYSGPRSQDVALQVSSAAFASEPSYPCTCINGGLVFLRPEHAASRLFKRVGNEVIRAAQVEFPQLHDIQWSFSVQCGSMVNASADRLGENAYDIVVTVAMLQLLQEPGQLAALIAHEVAHIAERHHDKEAEVVRETARRAIALGEAAFSNSLRLSTLEALDVFGLLVALASLRQHEIEADIVAMCLLARTGVYKPQHMIDLLQVFSSLPSEDGQANGAPSADTEPADVMFRTHPTALDRAAATTAALPEARQHTRGFAQLRWRRRACAAEEMRAAVALAERDNASKLTKMLMALAGMGAKRKQQAPLTPALHMSDGQP